MQSQLHGTMFITLTTVQSILHADYRQGGLYSFIATYSLLKLDSTNMHTSSFPHTASRLTPFLSYLPVGAVWDLQHTLMADATQRDSFFCISNHAVHYHFYYRVSNSFQPLTPVQSPLQSALYGITPARPKMLSIVLVYIYRKIVPVVRLGGLAPARPINVCGLPCITYLGVLSGSSFFFWLIECPSFT